MQPGPGSLLPQLAVQLPPPPRLTRSHRVLAALKVAAFGAAAREKFLHVKQEVLEFGAHGVPRARAGDAP